MTLRQAIGFLLILKIVPNVPPLLRRMVDVIICLAQNVLINFVGFVWEIGLDTTVVINLKAKILEMPDLPWKRISIITTDIRVTNNQKNLKLN